MINDYSSVLFDGLKIGDLNLGSPTPRVLVIVISVFECGCGCFSKCFSLRNVSK
jgi:hypothetical protein